MPNGYSRRDIIGKTLPNGDIVLTPTDLKSLNDTLRMIFLHAFGNISTTDLSPTFAKELDLSNNKSIDLNGVVRIGDLDDPTSEANGKIVTIADGVVTASTIAVDQLTTPVGHKRILRLFDGDASLDATLNMEDGEGTEIRLKWDKSNYIVVAKGQVSFYLGDADLGTSELVFKVNESGAYYRNVALGGQTNVVPVFG